MARRCRRGRRSTATSSPRWSPTATTATDRGSARGDVALDSHPSAEARRRDRAAVDPRLGERAQRSTCRRRAAAPDRRRTRRPAGLDPARRAGGGLPGARPGAGHHPAAQPRRIQPQRRRPVRHRLRPADDFPPDDSGYGFDNIGDVLSVSPVLTEKYFNAAEQVVSPGGGRATRGPRRVIRREDLRAVAEPAAEDRASARAASRSITRAPTRSTLKLSVNSFRPFFGKARVRVELDGRQLVRRPTWRATGLTATGYRLPLGEGDHVVRFTLDLSDADPERRAGDHHRAGRAVGDRAGRHPRARVPARPPPPVLPGPGSPRSGRTRGPTRAPSWTPVAGPGVPAAGGRRRRWPACWTWRRRPSARAGASRAASPRRCRRSSSRRASCSGSRRRRPGSARSPG